MQYLFKGFSEALGIRFFQFEYVAADRSRTVFTVGANLALARRYGIPLQELPLLCRHVLKDLDDIQPARDFTFTEQHMQTFAGDRQAARDDAAAKRKMVRRPPTDRTGTAWRSPGH